MSRSILHVDMNSYFATLEQQANPFLRGKPIVIGGKGHGGVVVTASVEAKALGVRVPAPAYQIEAEFPDVEFVWPTFALYSHVTRQLLQVFHRYSSLVELFSADEAFLDITQSIAQYGSIERLVHSLKSSIRLEVGEWVCCSVGVASNKIMAKLASDQQKPDGLVIFTPDVLEQTLQSISLTEICGIGPRLFRRLRALRIYSIQHLRDTPFDVLVRSFGLYTAQWLKDVSFGSGSDELVPTWESKKEKSMGHQQTIVPTYNTQKLLTHFLHLSEKVGRRLRKKGYKGRTIVIRVRYQSFYSEGRRITLSRGIWDGKEIFEYVRTLFLSMMLLGDVRLVGVSLSNLEYRPYQRSLLGSHQEKMDNVLRACDQINDRYGEMVIRRGRLAYKSSKRDIPGLEFQKRLFTDLSGDTESV